jgi:hypothetical protein
VESRYPYVHRHFAKGLALHVSRSEKAAFSSSSAKTYTSVREGGASEKRVNSSRVHSLPRHQAIAACIRSANAMRNVFIPMFAHRLPKLLMENAFPVLNHALSKASSALLPMRARQRQDRIRHVLPERTWRAPPSHGAARKRLRMSM